MLVSLFKGCEFDPGSQQLLGESSSTLVNPNMVYLVPRALFNHLLYNGVQVFEEAQRMYHFYSIL